jgi:hypothetical protein
MTLQIMKMAAAALLTLMFRALPVQAGTLDDYYLQQFGESAGSAHPTLKAVSESAQPLEARCGLPLKHDLRRDWDKLEPATQSVLAKQLAAPVLSGEATLSSTHFVVHYATTGTDVPAPDFPYTVASWVQQVADSFEHAYTTYQVTYGYRPPPVTPYHIYLRSLAALRLYGQTSTTSPVPSAGFANAYGSYIEIDKDFTNVIYTKDPVVYTPLDSLQMTSAHEFHHAIQFGYNVFFDVWYGEATSTWYEGELYPLIRQNYNYVQPWFASSTRRLDLAVDANALSTGAGYGRWIFNRYLAEQHTPAIVRAFWEHLAPLPSPDGFSDIPMLPVINTILAGALPTDFLGFARRVYRQQDWPLPYDQTATQLRSIPLATYSSYPVNGLSFPKPEVYLEQYSFAYFRFQIPAASSLTITVNGTPAIMARAFRKDSSGNISEYNFSTPYPSSVPIANASSAAEIVLLLVNTSGDTTQNANFSTDGSTSSTAPVTPTADTTTSRATPIIVSSGGGGGGCFIATAAYGSYLHPQVQLLRDFRDTRLLTNASGRAFVALYYRLSPPVAGFIAGHGSLRLLVRLLLTPLVLAITHPTAAGALLLAAAFGLAGRVRSRKRNYCLNQDQAV